MKAEVPAGRADTAARKRGTRGGRQKGCYIYIPAEQLTQAGFDPHGELPWYRVTCTRHGTVLVNLYHEA